MWNYLGICMRSSLQVIQSRQLSPHYCTQATSALHLWIVWGLCHLERAWSLKLDWNLNLKPFNSYITFVILFNYPVPQFLISRSSYNGLLLCMKFVRTQILKVILHLDLVSRSYCTCTWRSYLTSRYPPHL